MKIYFIAILVLIILASIFYFYRQNISTTTKNVSAPEITARQLIDKTEGQTIQVKIGETIVYKNISFKLNQVLIDSRCPVGADCFKPGEFVVLVEVSGGDVIKFYPLSNLGKPNFNKPGYDEAVYYERGLVMDDLIVSIGSVNPKKQINKEIKPGEYNIELQIKKKN